MGVRRRKEGVRVMVSKAKWEAEGVSVGKTRRVKSGGRK